MKAGADGKRYGACPFCQVSCLKNLPETISVFSIFKPHNHIYVYFNLARIYGCDDKIIAPFNAFPDCQREFGSSSRY